MNGKAKIDEIDIRILRVLLNEPRTTFAEIGKDCQLSITSVRNRFNSMVSSGIITGSAAQVDPGSIGYDCVSFVKAQINPKYKEETLRFLEKNPNIAVHKPHNATGTSSIVGFAVTRNADQLSQVVNQIRNNSNIRSINTAIWVDKRNMDYPQNLVIKKTDELAVKELFSNEMKNRENVFTVRQKSNDESRTGKMSKTPHELDSIDRSLIRILTKNARVPFRRIAESLGVSANSIIKKYKKLRKTILPFSSITLNLEKLGHMGMGIMEIRVSNQSSVKDAYNRIIEIPNIIVAIKVLGDFDILAITPFRTFEDLASVTEEISSSLDVYGLETFIDRPYTSWPLNAISAIVTDKLQII